MPTQKVPPYPRRTKVIGSVGMTEDLNADSTQLELISKYLNEELPDQFDGIAPQWVAGPQKAGALVFDGGKVYRVKVDLANSQSAPAGNPNNYLFIGYDDAALLIRTAALEEKLPQKVDAAAVVNGLSYASAAAAQLAAPPGGAITIRGNQPGIAFTKNLTVDASTANFGPNTVQFGALVSTTALLLFIRGYATSGRNVFVPQAVAGKSVVTVRGVQFDAGGYFEYFALQSGAHTVADEYHFIDCSGYRPAGSAEVFFTSSARSDANQRQVNWRFTDCNFRSDGTNSLFIGAWTRGSKIILEGSTKMITSPGVPMQATRSLDGGVDVPIADADIIVDNRPAAAGGGNVLKLTTATANRVSEDFPVLERFQITSEILDINAASVSYQLDTNTRTARVFGPADQTLAQINAQLAALTPSQISEGAKLYLKTVPIVAANPSVIILIFQ